MRIIKHFQKFYQRLFSFMWFCIVVMLSHFVVVKILDQRTTLFNRLKYSFHVTTLPFMTTHYPATSSLESKATP